MFQKQRAKFGKPDLHVHIRNEILIEGVEIKGRRQGRTTYRYVLKPTQVVSYVHVGLRWGGGYNCQIACAHAPHPHVNLVHSMHPTIRGSQGAARLGGA
jgi:hypothetical protein